MADALVVDDSKAIRMILSRILTGLGFSVANAANGKLGLSELEACGPGLRLILADWNMPEMNGLEFVRAVRARRAFDAVPIIMVTTETEIAQMVTALDAGVSEYIMKPFTEEMIAEKIRLLGIGLPVC